MGSAERLAAFDRSFERFLGALGNIPDSSFTEKLDSATPRELMAQLIGWNRLVAAGCRKLGAGEAPEYFAHADGDYAQVQAESLRAIGSLDRRQMAEQLSATKVELASYLSGLDASEWTRDRGLRHPEGGPVNVQRELEALTRRYLDATDEIMLWLDAHGSAG
ncbi:MAG TPA: hypothetical protein VLD63_07155 [Anaerolineales bacterium]|nr:hypothetical protein [Anaerolineales bacterium]